MIRGDLLRKAVISEAVHVNDEVLPSGWRWVSLGEVISLRSGVDLTKWEHNDKGEGVPYIIGASNFDDGKITITRWTTTPKTIAHRGEILFTCKGTVGEVAILQEEQAHIARQVWAVIPHDADTKYIVYVLQVKAQYLKSKAWTFIPGIRMKVLRDMVIPMPPIDEQRRIVAYLDPLVRELTELEEHLAKFRAARERFRKAAIQDAIHAKDEVLPAGWRWVSLGEIADLRHGVNFRKHEVNAKSARDVRILRGGNVLDDKLVTFKDDLFLPSANVKAVDYLQEQDIITPSVTSLVNVGKVAFIDHPIESTACGGFMYRVRVKSDEVLPKYLYFAMSSNFVKYQMKRMTHKSVVAFYNVTMKNFRTVLIPLPPIDQQRRIVNYLDNLSHQINHMDL